MARQLKVQPGNWLPVGWEEYVGKDSSHGAEFSSGWDSNSRCSMQILVGWQDGLQAELALLGYSYFDGSFLHRILPARHPYKPSYFAMQILSAQPVHWDDKLNSWQSQLTGISTGSPISEYSYWLLVVGFEKPKFKVLDDGQLLNQYGVPAQEWQRFVEVHPRMGTEMLSREGSQWRWSDAALGGINGTPLTAPVGVAITKSDLTVVWRRLPRRGLFADQGRSEFFNANIRQAANHLHNGATDLWGFTSTPPAGSEDMTSNVTTGPLMFLHAEAEAIASPFDQAAVGLTPFDYDTFYDLTLHFSVWQPPAGNTVMRGWNLAPNPDDNLWYLIATKGGGRIFPTKDLSSIFQLSDS